MLSSYKKVSWLDMQDSNFFVTFRMDQDEMRHQGSDLKRKQIEGNVIMISQTCGMQTLQTKPYMKNLSNIEQSRE